MACSPFLNGFEFMASLFENIKKLQQRYNPILHSEHAGRHTCAAHTHSTYISISLDLKIFDEKKTWLHVKYFIYLMIYCGFSCRRCAKEREREKNANTIGIR